MSDIRFNQWLHQSGTGGVSQVDGGHVGIGTTNPDIAVHTANTKKINVGIVTANSVYAGAYYGDGSNLTGLAADKIIEGDTKVEVVDSGDQYIVGEVNGSEKIRITSDGKIGIGIASPTFAAGGGVHLKGGNEFTSYKVSAHTNTGVDFAQDASGNAYVYNRDNADLLLGTNNTQRVRINNSGAIGLGGANYGTSGQVLTSQGSGSPVQWASPSGWVFGNAGDYDTWNSTTDVRLSGWPSTWKQIRINFVDISSNANAHIEYFVSKSSDTNSRIASGYQTQSGHFGSSQYVDSVTNMGRFSGTASSSYSMTGYVNFHKFNGNIIRYEGQLSEDGNSYIFLTNGHVTCDPTTDMTHIFFRCGGNSYDAGTFSIDYLA